MEEVPFNKSPCSLQDQRPGKMADTGKGNTSTRVPWPRVTWHAIPLLSERVTKKGQQDS